MADDKDITKATDDRELLRRMRDGLCHEIAATRQQLSGKYQQLTAIEKKLKSPQEGKRHD